MDKDRIVGAAKEFGGRVEGAVGDLTGDTKTQASGTAREAAGTVQNLYGQAKDAYENSGERLRDGTQALTQKVQDNPLGALLVAGGIGFALALLMSRPARRPPSRWRYYG